MVDEGARKGRGVRRSAAAALVAALGVVALGRAVERAGAGPRCVARAIGDLGPCAARQVLVLGAGGLLLVVVLAMLLRRHGPARALLGATGCPALGVLVGGYGAPRVVPAVLPDLWYVVVIAVVVGLLVGLWDRVAP